MAGTLRTAMPLSRRRALDVTEVYRAQADHVWASLARLGVDDADRPDLLQEVFAVVHRRSHDYDPERPLRGWLWGICVGLVRNHRRRAHRRLERPVPVVMEAGAAGSPHDALEARERRARGERILAALDPEKRAVFVMFEVEGMSGRAIAELLDVPIGTVHSRLHAARRELTLALAQDEEALAQDEEALAQDEEEAGR